VTRFGPHRLDTRLDRIRRPRRQIAASDGPRGLSVTIDPRTAGSVVSPHDTDSRTERLAQFGARVRSHAREPGPLPGSELGTTCSAVVGVRPWAEQPDTEHPPERSCLPVRRPTTTPTELAGRRHPGCRRSPAFGSLRPARRADTPSTVTTMTTTVI
jgi:hypothetical protein